MSDVVTFGGGVSCSLRPLTVATIFEHIRRHAPDQAELMRLVAREKEFDAIGGWFFDDLSLPALLRLQEVVQQLEAELPDAIAHWREDRRPLFYSNLTVFRQKLAERIGQLQSQPPSMG